MFSPAEMICEFEPVVIVPKNNPPLASSVPLLVKPFSNEISAPLFVKVAPLTLVSFSPKYSVPLSALDAPVTMICESAFVVIVP